MTHTSKRLTIFEGPDGGGKTTAAKEFALATGARYVHFDALPGVTKGLARMYVEAMLPALLGYQDVVFDRCWLSERPYGLVFHGRDRLTIADRRMLERLALRCSALVVKCLPPWQTVKANYLKRKHLEMLTDTSQLKQVYKLYLKEPTDLPSYVYDYTGTAKLGPSHEPPSFPEGELFRSAAHPLDLATAGRWHAPIVLVGETFAAHKDHDPLYQAPFVSFSNQGCSQWLTEQLVTAGVGEDELLWVNADDHLGFLELGTQYIYALGDAAWMKTRHLMSIRVPHPQHHKRFHAKSIYPLIDELRTR